MSQLSLLDVGRHLFVGFERGQAAVIARCMCGTGSTGDSYRVALGRFRAHCRKASA